MKPPNKSMSKRNKTITTKKVHTFSIDLTIEFPPARAVRSDSELYGNHLTGAACGRDLGESRAPVLVSVAHGTERRYRALIRIAVRDHTP
jgi:hypothetical protein